MSNATKRIPVTEESWKELGKIKDAGQTWDDVITELVEEHKKARLFRDMKEIQENSGFVPLDEV
jgi:predicted CopG family antitoxin